MSATGNYFGREQSLIKHIVLEKYLERFAVIIGKRWDGIIYVDGFSGPWNVHSEKLNDSSFSIALRQLRQARGIVRQTFNKDLKIKCIFLERNPDPYAHLRTFAEAQKDVDVKALNLDFERAIPDLLKQFETAGSGYFPFIFIDPTGWKGFAMHTIAPLLRFRPSEILVNFMTAFIVRFAEDSREEIGASFEGLFGDSSFRDIITGLKGREREDALVFEYAKRIGDVGAFPYTPIAVVPNPTKDRVHFHLVYTTRDLRGLDVFKNAERRALSMTGAIRADAKRRQRESRTNQPEFLLGSDAPDTAYASELRAHYNTLARRKVHEIILQRRILLFDEVCASGLLFPTVQIPSIREWIHQIAEFENLGPSDRVAKLGCGHTVRLR